MPNCMTKMTCLPKIFLKTHSKTKRGKKNKSTKPSKTDDAKKPLNIGKREISEKLPNSQKREWERGSLWIFCTF